MLTFSIFFTLFALGSIVLGFVTERACRAMRLSFPPALIAAFMIAAFGGGLTVEIVSIQAPHDLTADDASGASLEDGQITPHGWETILRRSLFAGVVGALMGGTFVMAGRVRRPRERAPA
jgi:hypothetical protein